MKILYDFSTHWDREWYRTFQGFRYGLVKMMDTLIEKLESGELWNFTFDGQTIVLEDYYEIRPENKERVSALIKSGKLKVGPWYIMPDEFLVSGESLIKNFLMGKQIAESYGVKAWQFGYMNDIFGHIAQMPQILNGFGIRSAYLGRGVGRDDQDYRNFLWSSPDGSECYAYKYNYAAIKRGLITAEDKDAFLKNQFNDVDFTGVLVMNFTDDHGVIDEGNFMFQKYLEEYGKEHELIAGMENMPCVLEEYHDALPKERGELAQTTQSSSMKAIIGTLSSYYNLKQQNDMCENLLENTVSPMMAMSYLTDLGLEVPFYELAYKYLLKNQPHDSICGCSIKEVHRDMEYRFSQVNSLATALSEDMDENFIGKYAYNSKEILFEIENYDLKKKDGVIVTDIKIPSGWCSKACDSSGLNSINSFEILDENGNSVPYEIIDITLGIAYPFCQARPKLSLPWCDVYKVALDTSLLPFGATRFKLVPGKIEKHTNSYSNSELCLENEYLKIEVASDGSLTMTDKENGKVYNGLNTFTDDGEVGNGWFNTAPQARNNIISSVGCAFECELLYRGVLSGAIKITKHLPVPECAEYKQLRRSDRRVTMDISTTVTLKKGCRYAEFETTVDNTAKDHRLCVNFPTGKPCEHYYASQAFTFIKRNSGISESGANYAEPEAYEKNTSGIIAVKAENGSLSFISKEGIHQGGVSNSGVISAVLLRCFGRALFNGVENGDAQLSGTHTFRYALSTESDLCVLNDIKKDMHQCYRTLFLEDKKSFESLMELCGNVNVSIVKPAEKSGGVVVRLFNPTDKEEAFKLKIKFDASSVSEVNLAEENPVDATIQNKEVSSTIAPHKIKTLLICK